MQRIAFSIDAAPFRDALVLGNSIGGKVAAYGAGEAIVRRERAALNLALLRHGGIAVRGLGPCAIRVAGAGFSCADGRSTTVGWGDREIAHVSARAVGGARASLASAVAGSPRDGVAVIVRCVGTRRRRGVARC